MRQLSLRSLHARVKGFGSSRGRDYEFKTDAHTDTAAITAVSTRRMVDPSDAEIHPAFSNAVSSSFFHPPSGPKASTTGSEPTGIASFRLKSRSISERTIRVSASIL